MALVTPLLLTVLGLTAEVGRSFFVATQVSNAAREGALWAGHHYADASASTSCSATNSSYADFEKNIKCVIQNEEVGALIGCPIVNQSYALYDPTTTNTLTSGVAPFNNNFSAPASPGSEFTNQLAVEVSCSVTPLIGLPPLPSIYKVTSKDTTLLLWPPK
jgi:Flp pilus assembly protein TadG